MSTLEKEIVYIAQLKGSLELSAEGVWIHNGVQFQNEKLSDLFSRSIVWNSEDHEYLVEIGNQRATFTCQDTAYFIRMIDDSTDPWIAHISDGSKEPLLPSTLILGKNNALYCTVHNSHQAKFLKSAHQTLATHVTGDNVITINGQTIHLSL